MSATADDLILIDGCPAQASKGSTLEEQRAWRSALYGEVMQLEAGRQIGFIHRGSVRFGTSEPSRFSMAFRLPESFLYLAVILDAYSPRVIGWALGNTLAELAVEALRSALEERPVNASLVHHSDRGVQYCARAYVDLLHSHGIQISMSRSGNPYDNALAESFMRTLKCEEVCLNSYRDLDDALLHIQDFLERIYNCERLHSSLGYLSPAAYEALTYDNSVEVRA